MKTTKYISLEEFEEWVLNLELQTLTDDLKQEIIDMASYIKE